MRITMLVVVGTAGIALAQEPVLKGPSVSSPERATLVEQDFNGRLKRLEVPPEEAALKLIAIDEMTKARTDKVLAERAGILDKAVIENLELISRIHNAGQSGDKAEALELFKEFAKKLEPLKARGKLVDEIKGVLPEGKRDSYAALVKGYHEAAVKDTMAAAGGEKLTMKEAVGREVLQAVGREIKRSYDRQITGRTADYEKLLAGLELKAEQETRIRNLVSDHFQATKGNPTVEQKREIFWKIYKELDRDQRRKLAAAYRGA
jgi:hypothetical protein